MLKLGSCQLWAWDKPQRTSRALSTGILWCLLAPNPRPSTSPRSGTHQAPVKH